ncbi:sodium/calcium exchanger 1 isoform X3 [Macrosteles quadrilineatus]|uniref:sodium/calcium exchanger 1 isoform X3 n=1 Tax=Macrosteles quadrilineatus TaxID=74068 RepID=UPI0023E11760|nr:sodium/calcium exchanger 1 isoform X3 [Macrosteles quadrilineatus]
MSEWLGATATVEDDNTSLQSCSDGLLLPVWQSQGQLTPMDRVIRGTVYLLVLLYLFLGVSIIADRFMSAIEIITSQEKEVIITIRNNVLEKKLERVWNETVANLTLMALGSSAPEILLSIIEIYAKNFHAGELGPGTIVGSAAYNLFCITALCISVIPEGETRKIDKFAVFLLTTFVSVFAYLWLYLILAVISESVVEVWEAVLTLLFFPGLVLSAYVIDKSSAGGASESEQNDAEVLGNTLEKAKADYSVLLRNLKLQYPSKDLKELALIAEQQIAISGPKSRAYYRLLVTRGVTQNVIRSHYFSTETKKKVKNIQPNRMTGTFFKFKHDTYTVMENIGSVKVTVVREGSDIREYVFIEYRTEDGTATEGKDYIATAGTLLFMPGEMEKDIDVGIIDDLIFESDEYFFIRLTGLRLQDKSNRYVKLIDPTTAKIVILDDDHTGTFSFEKENETVRDFDGVFELSVVRHGGARGIVRVPYRTKDGTAQAGVDYVETRGFLVFANNQIRRTIPIGIVPEHCYERNVSLYVELGEPEEVVETERSTRSPSASVIAANAVHSYLYGSYGSLGHKDNQVPNNINHKREEEMTSEEKIAMEGRPKLGAIARVQINIRESDEFKNTVDKLVQKRGASAISVSTSSWGEQFAEAIRVNPEPPEGEEDGLPETTGCGGYLIHFLTIFWKILFAFVPPAEWCNGWLCFWTSITFIGVLTAVIGDVSSHLGCTVGIKDAVTAICLVAMGTSLPDTFASKVAAIQDATADNSIGNVTGSNAVNVFLGIGVAWSIAAIYHAMHGNVFIVPPGNLGFSVMLFCTEALFAIAVLMIRRSKYVGGELGGPTTIKYITSAFMFSLWLFYITMSTLEAYGMLSF